jgi:hypothetical protein
MKAAAMPQLRLGDLVEVRSEGLTGRVVALSFGREPRAWISATTDPDSGVSMCVPQCLVRRVTPGQRTGRIPGRSFTLIEEAAR